MPAAQPLPCIMQCTTMLALRGIPGVPSSPISLALAVVCSQGLPAKPPVLLLLHRCRRLATSAVRSGVGSCGSSGRVCAGSRTDFHFVRLPIVPVNTQAATGKSG